MRFTVTKRTVPSADVIAQKNHSEYGFYARDVDFQEFLEFLPYTPVVQLNNGKYMVWEQLGAFYTLKIRYKGKKMPVYVLEGVPETEIQYLKREREHPHKRDCNILRGLHRAENFSSIDLERMEGGELEQFYIDYADVTGKPVDYIRKIDVLRKYYDEDVYPAFIMGEITLDEAVERTFQVRLCA